MDNNRKTTNLTQHTFIIKVDTKKENGLRMPENNTSSLFYNYQGLDKVTIIYLWLYIRIADFASSVVVD